MARMKTKYYKPNRISGIRKKMLKDQSVNIIVEDFLGVDWQKKTVAFPCFVIFDSPEDFPGKFVVRLFDGTKPMRLIALKRSLEAARKTIPEVFIPVPRSETDHPKIVETWL